MSKAIAVLILSFGVLVVPVTAGAHELSDVNGKPISTHQPVWRQQSYGQDYRQGHSVNNALGNIVIWSPNTYNPYKAGSSVRFARPSIQIAQPKAGGNIPQIKSPSTNRYGSDKQ